MNRYQFNKEKLEFTRVRYNVKTILKRIFWFFLASIGLALIYYLIFGLFILSPAERELIRETQIMQSEYKRLSGEMGPLNKVLEELEVRDKSIYGTVLHSRPLDVTEDADISHYRQLMEDPSFALAYHADSVITGLELRALWVTGILYQVTNSIYDKLDSLKYLPAAFPLRTPSMEAMGATTGRRIHPFIKYPWIIQAWISWWDWGQMCWQRPMARLSMWHVLQEAREMLWKSGILTGVIPPFMHI